ncbi:hypothetical protein ACJX0J_039131, partial [Zea mays]
KVQVLLIHFFQMNINTPGNAIEKIVHFPALVLVDGVAENNVCATVKIGRNSLLRTCFWRFVIACCLSPIGLITSVLAGVGDEKALYFSASKLKSAKKGDQKNSCLKKDIDEWEAALECFFWFNFGRRTLEETASDWKMIIKLREHTHITFMVSWMKGLITNDPILRIWNFIRSRPYRGHGDATSSTVRTLITNEALKVQNEVITFIFLHLCLWMSK